MKIFKNSFFLFVPAIFFALFLAEVALRALQMYQPPKPFPAREEIYQKDESIGYRLWKSTKIDWRYPANNPEIAPIISNSDGFRGSRDFDEVDTRERILVVGDSFIFGNGVRQEERLTEQLELLRPDWRVDNLGMSGWGIDLMIRGLEHVGLKTNPKIVVLCVYTDDLRRVHPYYAGMGYRVPKFRLVDDELETIPYPYPNRLQRMRIYQALYPANWKSMQGFYRLNTVLLDRFLENSVAHDFMPVVAFIPGKSFSERDTSNQAFITRWTTDNNVALIDLTDALYEEGVASTYLETDWHWNPTGHRIAAEQIHRRLTDLGHP